MLFRHRLMRCFKSTLPGEQPVFSQSGSSTPSLLVPVNRSTHPETFCTPNSIQPNMTHKMFDVFSVDHRSRRWTPTGPFVSHTPHVVRSISMSKWYDDRTVVSSPDMPQHAKRCAHAARFVNGVSHQAMLASCHATSCSTDAMPDHIMSLRTLQCLACGWSLLGAFAVQRRCPWREN